MICEILYDILIYDILLIVLGPIIPTLQSSQK